MKTKDTFRNLLGIVVVVGFFTVLVVVFRTEMPQANKDIGLILIGVLGAKFSDIVSYFFGSSKGSADKSEALNNQNLRP